MSEASSHSRGDPDVLLAEVQQQTYRQTRGKLKIFFGSNAGVGKTFAMLDEARKRAGESVDVLIGYAEPHNRPETEAMLVGLELLPCLSVSYRGTVLREFDLDAALARRPAICCVDELAHTNAPGTRHPKRWQDVVELLDAGISVYTTLNVQHLESVNDLVERITGVQIRETLPDAMFDEADEVELIDIAPDELLERLREGRIYKLEQAAKAQTHFFTKGNLIALRELALRKTAERVDEQMQEHRRDERLRQVVPASEKVLVCVGPSPLSARLVRSAKRLAAGLRAKWVAVTVEPDGTGGYSSRDASQVQTTLKLAEELGAAVVPLRGKNVAVEILAYATAHNVTKIVIGKPDRPRWREIVFGSVVDELIRRSGQIDIYVIRGEAEKVEPRHGSALSLLPTSAPDWAGLGQAVAAVVATTLAGWPLYHRFGVANENILMLYLLAVLWVATRRSQAAAILTSVLGVVAFDITFVPPYYTLAVTDRQYLFTFAVMLLTALIISALTHRVRAQAEGARHRERRTTALLELSRDLAAAGSLAQIVSATERHVREFFLVPNVVLLVKGRASAALSADGAKVALDSKDFGVAQWSFEREQPAGRGTTTLPASPWTFLPLKGSRCALGVLGVTLDPRAGDITTDARQLIEAFAAQAALAIERSQLAGEAKAAWERVEAEFLRNTLLSGVSHELRTPLAGITGTASALLENHSLSDDVRAEMLETLISETQRMDRLVNNLLDMTRMESGGLSIRKEWMPVQEWVGATLQHLEHRLADRKIALNVPHDLPMIAIDATAMEQVLTNLLDNAVEYTPRESLIELSAWVSQGSLRISLADHGPGLPAGTEERVFDKFFRTRTSQGTPSRGIGLGLAICRAIVQAHGGKITAANRPGGGAMFTINLPLTDTPPAVDASA